MDISKKRNKSSFRRKLFQKENVMTMYIELSVVFSFVVFLFFCFVFL